MTTGPIVPGEALPGSRDGTPEVGLRSDYCLFQRGEVEFALSTRVAREILEARIWTPVPLAPPELIGAFSLRGEVIPLVRLDRFLGTASRPFERTDPVILLCSGDLRMAAAVDRVLTVRHIAPWEIRRPKDEGVSELVRGTTGAEDAETVIIDGDRLLARIAEVIAQGIRAPRALAGGLARGERGAITESTMALEGLPPMVEEG
jgi:chemotaxis signal transduction protein